jgi:hypothetical protein
LIPPLSPTWSGAKLLYCSFSDFSLRRIDEQKSQNLQKVAKFVKKRHFEDFYIRLYRHYFLFTFVSIALDCVQKRKRETTPNI